MRHIALLLVVACGPLPTADAGVDAGVDAGADAGLVRVDFRYRFDADGGCSDVCSVVTSVSVEIAASLVGIYYAPDAGRRCGINNSIKSDNRLTVDCVQDCPLSACCVPPGAASDQCAWSAP